jgi:hypothetical protein
VAHSIVVPWTRIRAAKDALSFCTNPNSLHPEPSETIRIQIP